MNQEQPDSGRLLEQASSVDFRTWYRNREFRQNIRNGKPYFNGPGRVPDPERHTPSRLLQCHRKVAYGQQNAPAESTDPAGIFWFGSQFEDQLVVPFLEDTVATTDTYVANSLWVDFTVDSRSTDLQMRGSTDPVVVDEDGTPLLLFEIKTKKTVEDLTEPDRHHRAQAHAYMHGLSEKHDRELTDAILLYGGRTDFEVRTFHVEFDSEFWNGVVLEWAETHSTYRLDGALPPASPEYPWECEYCSYRGRCGKTDAPFENSPARGLLPLTVYPRAQVDEYLQAFPTAVLTPTLAYAYPELAAEHGSYDWRCPVCETTVSAESTAWDGDTDRPPVCGVCSEAGRCSELAGPSPQKQATMMEAADA